MFNEEISNQEKETRNKASRKEKILSIVALIVMLAAMASMFYCGYQVSDATFAERNNDDYQFVKDVVKNQYNFNDYDSELAVHSAINGYLDALGDDYAIYMSPEEYEKRQMSGKGESIALGLEIGLTDELQIVVLGLTQGGNAINSGIAVGDILMSINGQSVASYEEYKNFTIQTSFNDGDNVEVVVSRDDELLTFNIVTKKITSPVCELTFIENIAYIKLATFSETSATKFLEYMNTIKSTEDCKGIILDLRNNGGGMVNSMQKIAGCFLDEKLIATFEYKNKDEKHYAHKNDGYTNLPLVVLVNGKSASASECLTGALQCHERATIVGTQTYGKGIGQATYECPSGGYVTITTSRYYLPDGTWIHGVGITPDEVIDLPEDIANGTTEMTMDNDSQFLAAKNIFKNK